MKPSTWHEALYDCQTQAKPYVLVTLLASAGSTPRDAGTKMLVTEDSCYDTIGGGHLELEVSVKARALLAAGEQIQHIEHYPLSSKLGQCCGGATNVLFEVMVQHNQSLTIYGAGHVAKALIPILSKLPLQICWVDQRQEMFIDQQIANNVVVHCDDDPVAGVAKLTKNSWVLILTHNHQLDFDLVNAALKRNDLGFVGMIGSQTKSRRFKMRLKQRGYVDEQINRLVSPVGLLDIPGKHPTEVAVSISAQVIQLLHRNEMPTKQNNAKDAWINVKKLANLI